DLFPSTASPRGPGSRAARREHSAADPYGCRRSPILGTAAHGVKRPSAPGRPGLTSQPRAPPSLSEKPRRRPTACERVAPIAIGGASAPSTAATGGPRTATAPAGASNRGLPQGGEAVRLD